MADIIDIQTALVAIASAAVYPLGISSASITGAPILLYPGWPNAAQLDTDLSVGSAHITVFPTQIESNKTRYPLDWRPSSIAAGSITRELRRQDRVFQITAWCSTPTQRDTIGAALDIAMAQIEFLALPDGYGARMIYRNSHVTDDLEKAKIYRRDFQYSVEYATTQTMSATVITQTITNTTLIGN